MDGALVIVGFVLMLLGLIGSILPILPGAPISWLGLLLLHLSDFIPMDRPFLLITAIIAVVIFVLDYIIPVVGTKRFGGSKSGAIGTTIGLIVGILTPVPFGILIGPFLGAFIGETVFNKSDRKTATRAAFGSFIGFLASTFMKFTVCLIYLGLFIYKLVPHTNAILA